MFKRRALFVFIFGLVFYSTLGCALFTTTPISTITSTQTSGEISTTFTTESQLTIQLKGIYNLAVTSESFSGTYDEWLESIRGPQGIPGENGQQVVMRVSGGYIQWKYQTAGTWNNLVELQTLMGPQGIAGTNGEEVSFQVANGFLQWKYSDEIEWHDLFDLITLQGEDAVTPTISINHDGYWVINGVVTEFSAINPTDPYYTVTFHLNGGTFAIDEPLSLSIQKGNSIHLPIPEYIGYTFKGWMTGTTVNDMQFTNYMPVTKDMDLYAIWEIDMGLVDDFFNTIESDNFTFSKVIDSSIITTEGTIIFDLDQNTRLSPTDGGYLIHQTEVGLTEVPGMISLPANNHSYQLYSGESMDDVMMFYNLQIDNGDWDVTIAPSYFSTGIDLSMFDSSLFVKRDNEIIYDYPASPELVAVFFEEVFGMFLMELPYSVDYDVLTCVLNLDTHQLTIDMSGTAYVAMLSNSDYDIHIELNLSEIGTTNVVLPFDEIKTDLVDTLANEISSIKDSMEYQSSTIETSEGFDLLASELMANILVFDSPQALFDAYKSYCIQIFVHQFEIDYLRLYKENAQLYLYNQVELIRWSSTDQSLVLMEALRADYTLLVDNATEEDEIDLLVIVFDDAIEGVIEFDLTKMGLKIYRQSWIINLNLYLNIIDYLSIEAEQQRFFSIYNNRIIEMNQATDLATIDAVYLAAYESFMLEDFTFENTETLMLILTRELENHYMSHYHYVDEGFDDLTIFYNTLLDSLALETNPVEMLFRYNEIVHEFYEYLFPYVLPRIDEDMDLTVERFGPYLNAEVYLKLQNGYNQTLLLIASAFDIDSIDNYYNNFYIYASNLPIDPWRALLVEARTNVESIFTSKAVLATPESALPMQGVYDDFLISIELVTEDDTAALDMLVQETLDLIQLNYIIDPLWVPIVEARLEATNDLIQFFDTGYVYLQPGEGSEDYLNSILASYLDSINSAISIEDINYRLNGAKETLSDTPCIFVPYDSLTNQLIDNLSAIYTNWYNEYGIEGVDIISVIEDFMINIGSAHNPYDTLYVYEYTIELMNSENLAIMSEHYRYLVINTYYDYQYLVPESSLDELYALQVLYADAMMMNAEFELFEGLMNEFITECELLVLVP